jgi:hypothetical protein
MSQIETMIILRELGGRATSKVIRDRCKEKFPNYSLWQYVTERLNRLIYYGDVGFDKETKEYFIIEKKEEEKVIAQSIS